MRIANARRSTRCDPLLRTNPSTTPAADEQVDGGVDLLLDVLTDRWAQEAAARASNHDHGMSGTPARARQRRGAEHGSV